MKTILSLPKPTLQVGRVAVIWPENKVPLFQSFALPLLPTAALGLWMTILFAICLVLLLIVWWRYHQLQQTAAREHIAQETLRATLYSIGHAVITTDKEGRVRHMNPVAQHLTGWPETAAYGRPLTEIFHVIHQDSRQPVANPVARILHEGIIMGLANHTLLISREGVEYPIANSGASICATSGDILGVVLVFRDQTAEYAAALALQQQAERLERAEQHALLGSWEFDVTTGQGWWSPQMYALLGYNPDDGVPSFEAYLEAIHPDDRSLVNEVLGQMSRGETPSSQEFRSNPERGSLRYFMPTVHGLHDKDGHLTKLMGTLLDITTRKEGETTAYQNEARYRHLAEAMPFFLCAYLPDSTLTYVNKTYADYMGKPAAELLGQPFLNFLPDVGARAKTKQRYLSLTPRNPSMTHEHLAATANGIMRWQRWTITAVFDAQGQLLNYQGIGQDITEEKQAEQERQRLWDQIQQQANRVQAIVDTVPEGVMMLDDQFRILMANPTAERYLRSLARNAWGTPLTHLGNRPMPELVASPPAGLWHELEANNRLFELIARPIGQEQWVLVLKDVTQAHQARTELYQQGRLAAVGQLAAGIAHDFNNILASIILYAQLLRRTANLAPAVMRRLEVIETQSSRAADLIRQILDFSRRATLERQPLDLLALLKEQIKLLQRTLPESIDITFDSQIGHYAINADPTRMQQMITNLGVNARDALPDGGTLHFELSHITVLPGESPLLPEMPAGEWLKLQISDTGTGIPAEILPRIFEPFFTTKAPGVGTGLGLAQVYGIVSQHEGRLAVNTAVGEGTTFTIYLPALPITAAEPAPLDTSPFVTGQGEVVLVVEDDAAVRAALVATLESLQYKTMEAADGQEALQILEANSTEIALVLCDVVMPKMGGIPFFHALHQQGWDIPVILLTGHPIESELEPLVAQGLAGWLPKPPSIRNLASIIADVV